MGFTEPIPTAATAHLLYESRESLDFQPDSSSLMMRLKQWAAVRDLRSMLDCLNLPARPAILDFSCGDGMFTLAAKVLLPDSKAMGSDMHSNPPPLLGAENYLTSSELESRGSAWDVILCRHVLEHSYTPVEMLLELRKLLRPGGFLVIEVPALDAMIAGLFGRYWDGYYAPFHPMHFTRGPLRAALEAAGYKVVRESSAEMPKMGRSLQNVFHCSYNLALFGLGIVLQPLQVGIGKLSGRPVCLRIWGQKQ
jgi:SAM-dependent methyltransferase